MSKQSGKVGQLEEVVEVEETEDAEKLDEDRESPRRNRSPSRVQVQETICEAYKKRECQHGLTGKRLINGKPCPHSHPPRCFRWCKHGDNKKAGCTKGSDCTYYHPKLCKNSVLKRYCANRECTFHHLKHTRRPRDQLPRETRGDNNPSCFRNLVMNDWKLLQEPCDECGDDDETLFKELTVLTVLQITVSHSPVKSEACKNTKTKMEKELTSLNMKKRKINRKLKELKETNPLSSNIP